MQRLPTVEKSRADLQWSSGFSGIYDIFYKSEGLRYREHPFKPLPSPPFDPSISRRHLSSSLCYFLSLGGSVHEARMLGFVAPLLLLCAISPMAVAFTDGEISRLRLLYMLYCSFIFELNNSFFLCVMGPFSFLPPRGKKI